MTDESVFPDFEATKFGEDPTPAYPCVPERYSPVGGLTKRELFAAMAMQGLCANSQSAKDNRTQRDIAIGALLAADALLEALEAKGD